MAKQTKKPEVKPEVVTVSNSFEHLLRHQRRGKLLSEVSEAVQKAVLAVREHMKDATVTIKLKLSPADGEADALTISDEVTSKLPQPNKGKSLFYATDDGVLQRDDPNQSELEFTPVPSANTGEPQPAVSQVG